MVTIIPGLTLAGICIYRCLPGGGVNLVLGGTASPINPPSTTTTASSNAGPTDRRTRLTAENEPKKHEAGKLIKYVLFLDPKSASFLTVYLRYHLDNYKRSSQYFLPASLRPTLVQRTVPHGSFLS